MATWCSCALSRFDLTRLSLIIKPLWLTPFLLKITTNKHDFVATSTPNSAWAVWRENSKGPPVITGPPVEYGEGEEAYVAAIAEWFAEQGVETERIVSRSSGGGEDVEVEEFDFDFR